MKNFNFSAGINQRIQHINERLIMVEDPVRRTKLMNRLAMLEKKKVNQKNAAIGNQARVAKRLQKVDRLLSQTEEKRENLEKRKAHLESKLAAQKEMMAQAEAAEKAGTIPQKEGTGLGVPKDALADRIKNIENRLADPETNENQRKKLTNRLAMLKHKQQQKSAKQMTIDERVKHIELRLADPNMNENQRKRIANRLAMFKRKQEQQQNRPKQMTMDDRIKNIENRLADPNTNDNQRKKLTNRLAMLKRKQQQQQNPAKQLTMDDRIKNIENRLADPNTNENQRKKLMNRLAMLKHKQQVKQAQSMKLEERVKFIEQRLANPEIPEKQRQNLTHRLSILKAKQQGKAADLEIKALQRNMLQKRVEHMQERLAKEDLKPKQREQLQKRVVFFQAKLENKANNNNNNNKQPGNFNRINLEQRLKRQEQLLDQQDLDDRRRQEAERRVACIRAKLQNHERRGEGGGIFRNVRAKNQQNLTALAQRAREAGDEDALARIALQQVYVAHYPTEDNEKYIPLCNKQMKKKAGIRQKALELARTEAGVDWIAPDQYERLPDHWTVEDEIAMFGRGKNWKKIAPFNKNNQDEEAEVADGAYDFVEDGEGKEDAGDDFDILNDNDEEEEIEVDGLDWIGVDPIENPPEAEEDMKTGD